MVILSLSKDLKYYCHRIDVRDEVLESRMSAEHPTFANPAIREALCELHFDLSPGETWSPSWLGKIYHYIEDDFPDFEPAEPAFQLRTKPDQIGLAPGLQRMRYRHGTRPVLLQLSEGILTINLLEPYPGWSQMQTDIIQAWKSVQEFIPIISINRIGLRYINLISREKSQVLRDWFQPNDYVAEAALDSHPTVLSRVEVHQGKGQRVIVTMAQHDEDVQGSNFLLDIDCISENSYHDLDALAGPIDKLHDKAWNVFSRFLTPQLTRRLQEDRS